MGWLLVAEQKIHTSVEVIRTSSQANPTTAKQTANSNFVTGARIAVLLCTETTLKIYRGGAEVDFFSRSRYYNKNYGYPSTSDEGYFFSETVDNYEFYHLEITLSESFIEFRGYFRDWQFVYYM